MAQKPSPPTKTDPCSKYEPELSSLYRLLDPGSAEDHLQRTTKLLRRDLANRFEKYERAWVYHWAWEAIRKSNHRGRLSDYDEEIELDSASDGVRLKHLPYFLDKLSLEDRLLILLRFHSRLDWEELSAALQMPEASLKLRMDQVTAQLVRWIWAEPAQNGQLALRRETLGAVLAEFEREEAKTEEITEEAPITAWTRAAKRWSQTPWFFRSSMEGVGIALIIFLFIAIVPKIREMYQKSLERKLSVYEMTQASLEFDELSEKPLPLDPSESIALNEAASLVEGGSSAANDPCMADPFAPGCVVEAEGEEAVGAAAPATPAPERKREKIRVGHRELWRFIIRTAALDSTRDKVRETLAGVEGLEIVDGEELQAQVSPGGVNFEVLVPRKAVGDLKYALEDLAEEASQDLEEGSVGETFSWFKNRARKRMRSDQTHVMVFLKLL